MASPSIKTIKRLHAISGNKCAFPECPNPIAEESGTITGEIAHICAASPKGPRYDPEQGENERHGFGNLILLCSRHHTIIDSEVDKYPVTHLLEIKRKHELKGAVEITPYTIATANKLLEQYEHLTIVNQDGNIAINSPGIVQAQTVNLKSSKKSVQFTPPNDSIGANASMASYVEYLINKYQDYQKQDSTKEGRGKYTLIYNAIKRKFGCKWQTIPTSNFDLLIQLLRSRIDNSKVGRIRKARNQKRYHNFEEHNKG